MVREWYSKNCHSVVPRIVNQFVEATFVGFFDVSSGDKDVQMGVNGLLRQTCPIHENTDWSDVPGISAAEAGAWIAWLIEA